MLRFLLFSSILNDKQTMSVVRFTAHPWLRDENVAVPLDSFIYKSVKAYLRVTPFKRAALKVMLLTSRGT